MKSNVESFQRAAQRRRKGESLDHIYKFLKKFGIEKFPETQAYPLFKRRALKYLRFPDKLNLDSELMRNVYLLAFADGMKNYRHIHGAYPSPTHNMNFVNAKALRIFKAMEATAPDYFYTRTGKGDVSPSLYMLTLAASQMTEETAHGEELAGIIGPKHFKFLQEHDKIMKNPNIYNNLKTPTHLRYFHLLEMYKRALNIIDYEMMPQRSAHAAECIAHLKRLHMDKDSKLEQYIPDTISKLEGLPVRQSFLRGLPGYDK